MSFTYASVHAPIEETPAATLLPSVHTKPAAQSEPPTQPAPIPDEVA